MTKTIAYLPDYVEAFPAPEDALEQPEGLLAMGGNLKVETLLIAYANGIFPWFNEGDPILWWSPAERMVFVPGELHLSRSLRKLLRKDIYQVTIDHDFPAVIKACADTRRDSDGTWITSEMIQAYSAMHHCGYGHSIEVWRCGELVGGLYGVALGKVFFAESMFSKESNTSKIAMASLSCQLSGWGFKLVDCQLHSAHLESMGASLISRAKLMNYLRRYCAVSDGVDSSVSWKQVWQWSDDQS